MRATKKEDIREMLSHEALASFLPKEECLNLMKDNQAQSESVSEKFSHLWTSKVFLKREDVAKEDVETVLGILVKAIGVYDSEYGDADPEEFYDDESWVSPDGAAYTTAELITLIRDKYGAEVDAALSTVSGSVLVKQTVSKIVQSSILDRFSATYQTTLSSPTRPRLKRKSCGQCGSIGTALS